jgi:hypothetical protein
MAKSTVEQYVLVNNRLLLDFFYLLHRLSLLSTAQTYSISRLQHYSLFNLYSLLSYPMYQHLNTGLLMLPFRDKIQL